MKTIKGLSGAGGVGVIVTLVVVGAVAYYVGSQQDDIASFLGSETASNSAMTPTVQWHIADANPNDADYNGSYANKEVFIDVTSAGNTKRYPLGKSTNCSENADWWTPAIDWENTISRLRCGAHSWSFFVASSRDGKFIVERYNESGMDGSFPVTMLLEI